jgi:uncharacterized membrane protein YbaN (DUF454 family)
VKILFVTIGVISLVLGLIGVALPILPTTPFLLLTTYFFAKGSNRFSNWFKKTKIYQNYVVRYISKHGMSVKQKIKIMMFSDVMIIISFLSIDIIALKILLVIINTIKYYYFIFRIKTIPGGEKNGISQQKSNENSCVEQIYKSNVKSNIRQRKKRTVPNT